MYSSSTTLFLSFLIVSPALKNTSLAYFFYFRHLIHFLPDFLWLFFSSSRGIYPTECHFSPSVLTSPHLESVSQAQNLFLHIHKSETDLIRICSDVNKVFILCLNNLFKTTAIFVLSQWTLYTYFMNIHILKTPTLIFLCSIIMSETCNYEKLAFCFTKNQAKTTNWRKSTLIEYYFFEVTGSKNVFSGISVRLFKNSSKHFHTKLGFEIFNQTGCKYRSPCSFWVWLPKEAQKTWPPSIASPPPPALTFPKLLARFLQRQESIKKAQKWQYFLKFLGIEQRSML